MKNTLSKVRPRFLKPIILLICLSFAIFGCSEKIENNVNNIFSSEYSFSKNIIAEDIKSFGKAAINGENIFFFSNADGIQIVEINKAGDEIGRFNVSTIGTPSELIVTDELYAFADIDFEYPNENKSCVRFISRDDMSERSYLLSSIIPDYSYGEVNMLEYDGIFYIQYSRIIVKIDQYGNVKDKIQLDSEAIDICIDLNGNIYVLTYNRELECYNKKGVGDKKDYSQINSLYASAIYISGNEIYIVSEDNFYSYNTESGVVTLLSLWSDVGIYSSYITSIFKNESGIAVLGRDVINNV